MTEEAKKEKAFDFTGANDAGVKVDEEEEVEEEVQSIEEELEEAKIDKAILQEKLDNRGKVTPAIIKEARLLAETGLDIDAFFTKHKLVGVDIETLLQAPLDKDGNYA